jgi:hypothetical protein
VTSSTLGAAEAFPDAAGASAKAGAEDAQMVAQTATEPRREYFDLCIASPVITRVFAMFL